MNKMFCWLIAGVALASITSVGAAETPAIKLERAALFTARNPGAVNHGAQSVPLAALPPVLAALMSKES